MYCGAAPDDPRYMLVGDCWKKSVGAGGGLTVMSSCTYVSLWRVSQRLSRSLRADSGERARATATAKGAKERETKNRKTKVWGVRREKEGEGRGGEDGEGDERGGEGEGGRLAGFGEGGEPRICGSWACTDPRCLFLMLE